MPEWRERVRQRLGGLRLDPASEAEVVEELTQHVDDRYRDLIARGVPEADALACAWTELEGHPRLAREISAARTPLAMTASHDVSRSGLTALWDDFVFAWRRLRHAPGFTAVALITVMLTVGANTAILSIADAVLFRPLPYAEADQIAVLDVRNKKTGQRATLIPYSYLDAINADCPSLGEVGVLEVYDGRGPDAVMPTIETEDGRVGVPAVEATPNYFQILGVQPAAGRLFNISDVGREGQVALLTYSAWLQMFGGNPEIVGRPITLGALQFDLVGVLPRGFVFPSPFAGKPSLVVLRKPLTPGQSGGTFHPIVRIASGVSRDRAQAEVEAAASSAIVTRGDDRVDRELSRWAGTVPVVNDVRSLLYPTGRPIMRFLVAAAAFILLLGCANLANMMVVRGRRGLGDTAVRLALGASRGRLIRPMAFEALMIGVGGAVLALVLTSVTFDTLLTQVPSVAYGRADVGVDARVFALGLLMGLFCAVSFSVVPAWRASGVDVLALIQRRGGRGSRVRLGRPLVALQVAIAFAVVFGAVVATRAFVRILNIPVGFSSERVVRIFSGRPADMSGAEYRAAVDRVIAALASRPDVEAVGAAGSLPFSGQAPDDGIRAAPESPLQVGIIYALPGYLDAIGVRPLRGRTWNRDDAQKDHDGIVLSTSAAKTLFGDQDPIGRTLEGRNRQFHVIGVVGEVRNFIDRETAPLAYAIPPPGRGVLSIVVKARFHSAATLAALKADTRKQFPVVIRAEWWEDVIAATNSYRNPRFQTMVLLSLGSLALGLTALGIFSVVAYLVAARAREMGIRLAIGATPQSLVRLVIRETLLPVGGGLAAGFLLIQWGKKLAEAQLFELKTNDAWALVGAVVTVLVAACAAAYLPARRATKIDPVTVLRAE